MTNGHQRTIVHWQPFKETGDVNGHVRLTTYVPGYPRMMDDVSGHLRMASYLLGHPRMMGDVNGHYG